MNGCNTEDFREKAVVNSCDGRIIGNVAEVIFDVCDGKITAIVVREECGFFSFKRNEDIIVPWCKIVKIGEDVIIVDAEDCFCRDKRGKPDFIDKKGRKKQDEDCCNL